MLVQGINCGGSKSRAPGRGRDEPVAPGVAKGALGKNGEHENSSADWDCFMPPRRTRHRHSVTTDAAGTSTAQ